MAPRQAPRRSSRAPPGPGDTRADLQATGQHPGHRTDLGTLLHTAHLFLSFMRRTEVALTDARCIRSGIQPQLSVHAPTFQEQPPNASTVHKHLARWWLQDIILSLSADGVLARMGPASCALRAFRMQVRARREAGRTYTQRLCKGALLVREAFRQAKAEVCWVIHKLRPSRSCGVTVCLAMARRRDQGQC